MKIPNIDPWKFLSFCLAFICVYLLVGGKDKDITINYVSAERISELCYADVSHIQDPKARIEALEKKKIRFDEEIQRKGELRDYNVTVISPAAIIPPSSGKVKIGRDITEEIYAKI